MYTFVSFLQVLTQPGSESMPNATFTKDTRDTIAHLILDLAQILILGELLPSKAL